MWRSLSGRRCKESEGTELLLRRSLALHVTRTCPGCVGEIRARCQALALSGTREPITAPLWPIKARTSHERPREGPRGPQNLYIAPEAPHLPKTIGFRWCLCYRDVPTHSSRQSSHLLAL